MSGFSPDIHPAFRGHPDAGLAEVLSEPLVAHDEFVAIVPPGLADTPAADRAITAVISSVVPEEGAPTPESHFFVPEYPDDMFSDQEIDAAIVDGYRRMVAPIHQSDILLRASGSMNVLGFKDALIGAVQDAGIRTLAAFVLHSSKTEQGVHYPSLYLPARFVSGTDEDGGLSLDTFRSLEHEVSSQDRRADASRTVLVSTLPRLEQVRAAAQQPDS